MRTALDAPLLLEAAEAVARGGGGGDAPTPERLDKGCAVAAALVPTQHPRPIRGNYGWVESLSSHTTRFSIHPTF